MADLEVRTIVINQDGQVKGKHAALTIRNQTICQADEPFQFTFYGLNMRTKYMNNETSTWQKN